MKEYLPVQRKRKYDRRATPLRDIVDATFWYLRVGGQWRNLPENFPKWGSVYYYFRKWKADGTLERLNAGMNRLARTEVGKQETPSMFSIDTQSVKVAPFINQDKGVDGNKKVNGRKRHVITDTLGLVWGVVVHAAHQADGAMGERVVEPLQGYMYRMKKILADAAYKKVFMSWVYENLLGVELEISSRPPTTEGFVRGTPCLLSGGGSQRGLLAPLISLEDWIKMRGAAPMKKPLKAQKLGYCGRIAKSLSIV